MGVDELGQDGLDGVPTMDDCVFALVHVHSFLHGEVDDETADEVRHHLMTCERCLETYDIESLITTLVRRSHQRSTASVSLRERVSSLHVVSVCD